MKAEVKSPQDLDTRTKEFALGIVHLYTALPKTTEAQVLGRQLLKSGTSVGAHYREARRAKSNADFVSKIEGALQELDETTYWLELLADAGIREKEDLAGLMKEADELIAILVTVAKSAKSHPPKPK